MADGKQGFDRVYEDVRIGDIQIMGRPLESYSPTEFKTCVEIHAFSTAVMNAIPEMEDMAEVYGADFVSELDRHGTAIMESNAA